MHTYTINQLYINDFVNGLYKTAHEAKLALWIHRRPLQNLCKCCRVSLKDDKGDIILQVGLTYKTLYAGASSMCKA